MSQPCLKLSRAPYHLTESLMPQQSLKGTALSGLYLSGHFLCCMLIPRLISLLTCISRIYHLVTHISVFTSCFFLLLLSLSLLPCIKPRSLLSTLRHPTLVERCFRQLADLSFTTQASYCTARCAGILSF